MIRMVKTLKLEGFVFDKHRIFQTKIVYDPETRLGTAKRGFRSASTLRFFIDPDHIYTMRKGLREKNLVFIDNASRRSVKTKMPVTVYNPDGSKKLEEQEIAVDCAESVKMHSDNPIDEKTSASLDVLTERNFWRGLLESIMGKRKLPVSTLLIILFAGAGLYHVLLVVLRVFGFNV